MADPKDTVAETSNFNENEEMPEEKSETVENEPANVSDGSEEAENKEESSNEETAVKSVETEATEPVEEEEDEPEIIDPMDTLREECRENPSAKKFQEIINKCEERLVEKTKEWEERGKGPYPEHCQQELVDLIVDVDKCVAKTLFSHLK